MSSEFSDEDFDAGSRVGEDHVAGELPPEPHGGGVRAELTGYAIGLVLAAALTAAAFFSLGSHSIYAPGIVMAVIVLGLAQVGVHLVFFLHMTTSPDNTNNILALAFGLVIVCIVVFGTIWAMYHMNHNMI
jgi:cytochrome o ubiquinol oxidase subunit IV